ncbi:MAG: hypothetical protein K6G07_09115 [Lachnospiraceae bacterium]|nr:hypothetical protein [Lachnospiraceae bacterium]
MTASKRKDKGLAGYAIILVLCVFTKYIMLHHRGENNSLQLYLTNFVFVYLFALMIFYTLFKTVTRMVYYRKMRDQYRNAAQMIHSGFILSFILSLICIGGMFFLSPRITIHLFKMDGYGRATYLVFAGTTLLLFACAVLSGWFSGFRILSRIHPAILIFSISDLLFSLTFMIIATNKGKIHAALLHDELIVSAFASLGAALGLAFSLFLTFVWIVVMTFHYKRKLSNHIEVDYSRLEESVFQQIFAMFYGILTPFSEGIIMFGFFIFNTWLYFTRTLEEAPYQLYGAYLYDHLLWFVIFLIPTAVIAKRMENPLFQCFKNGDRMQGGQRMLYTLKQFLAIVMPGIFVVFAIYPMLDSAFFGTESIPFSMRIWNTLFVTLFLIQLLLLYMCYACGKTNIQILIGLGMFVLQSVISLFLLHKNATIQMFLICNLIFVLLLNLAYYLILYRKFCYRKRLIRHLVMPLASAVAALVTAALCTFLRHIFGNLISSIIAMVLSFVVHSLAIVGTNCISEQELREIPLQSLYLAIGQRIGIYKRYR